MKMTNACLFDHVESLQSSRKIGLILDVFSPRFIGERRLLCEEREESKVSIRHVLVLGTKEEPRHDWSL